VLSAFVPVALIEAAVSPKVLAITLFFVFAVLPEVLHSICIHIVAITLHVVVGPLPVVGSAVNPLVNASALYFVVMPHAFIHTPVCPLVDTLSVLFRPDVLTIILSAFWPEFYALAMLQIVAPSAFIPCSLGVHVLAEAVSLVIDPGPCIGVAVSVVESALSVGLVELPLAFISRAIWPDHDTVAMPHTPTPGPLITRACFVDVRATGYLFVYLNGFFLFEVLALHAVDGLKHFVLALLQKPTDMGLQFDNFMFRQSIQIG